MKTFKTTVKSLLSGLLCVAMSAPMLTSCYDDSAIWGEIDEITGRLDELDERLNGQIQAFNDLVAGGNLLIKSLQKQSDGSYVVTLSNGTTFGVLPTGISVKGLLSYKEVEGVKYWAMYNTNGELELLVGSSGNYIPVEAVVPTVKEKDGKFYLVVGDKEYETGFSADSALSVITGYELNKDESGNVYSVTFTFGEDGLTYTIPVDGYLGFSFRLGSAGNSSVIKDYYVDFGSTGQILAGMDGVEDYVLQVPEGWRVVEEVDELMGETYLNITAPSKAKVAAGEAVAEGNLKVIAVVEGGKAMAARLALTTSPFKTFTATSSNAVIEIHTGVDKYIYGVSAAPFDEAAVFAQAKTLLEGNDEGVATSDINMPLTEVYGAELSSGSRYVLWAMPAFYDYSEQSTGYSLKEGVTSSYEFTYNNIKMETVSVSYNDAVIKVDMGGAKAFYGGTELKSDDLFTDILSQINNDLIDTYTEPLSYEGSAFKFPVKSVLEPVSETTYVTWVVPAVEGKDKYLQDDIIYVEYTLAGITSGGSVDLVADAPQVTRTSINVPLSAEGANSIIYVYLKSTYAGRYSSDSQRADLLLESADSKTVHASSAEAKIERLAPETKMTLFAMAIDKDGKYGKPVAVEAVTEAMKYNDIVVTLGEATVSANKAEVPVTVSGDATDYIWWFGKEESDTFWTSSDMCGKSKDKGQQYMALYPDDSNIVRAMNKSVFADGVIKMEELAGDTQYVLMVLAKDDSGNYSKAGFVRFRTLAADLGVIVRAGTDTWKAAKDQVQITWHENRFRKPENSNMSAFYAFDIKVPKDLTAYILCMSDDYFDQNPDIRKEEDKILDIEKQCSRKYDAGIVVEGPDGDKLTEPDWVDDAGKTHDGTLMNVYSFYVHGYPTNGFATYFAEGSHGEGNCTSWEDEGYCDNYTYALNSITKRHSVDYFIEYVENTRGNYCKTQTTINKVAQDLFEAYYPYYKDAKPLIFENHGDALYMENHYAIGTDDSGRVVDDVYVVFIDKDGNYYEPMSFEVPNYFK